MWFVYEALHCSRKPDIFLLGKTLLHMLIGGEPPMYPDRILHQADSRYVPFINHCIEEYPDNRFQSVDEMLQSFSVIMSQI